MSALQLNGNEEILSEDEMKIAEILRDLDQTHIYSDWPPPGKDDQLKKNILQHAIQLDTNYPGGLSTYIHNARTLLNQSLNGINPNDGWIPTMPENVDNLEFGSPTFLEMEQIGVETMAQTGWILVAGGLGERLGFSGVKVSLPTEIVTEISYLAMYIQFILAHQARAREQMSNDSLTIPFVVMTSGDTHARTAALLERHNYFGMESSQLTVVGQEKVAALSDSNARIAMTGPYEMSTKPHGHGDIHALMHANGIAKKWAGDGIRWVCFFQDTNVPIMRALVPALGSAVRNNYVMNSVAYPRRPGEEVGSLTALRNVETNETITVNVEYNQLGPVLKTINGEGDVADETGFSPFPGNVNGFVVQADAYVAALEESEGAMPEFVNPKYTDETRTQFKKPTRLECMMQELPRVLDRGAPIGISQVETWLAHKPVKNNIVDAFKKYQATGESLAACAGEHAIYFMNREYLRHAGVAVEENGEEVYERIPVPNGAKVVLHPSFGTSLNEIRSRFLPGGRVSISKDSTLVLEGNVEIKNLELDGTLIVRATEESKVVIENLTVVNDGWELVRVSQEDETVDETYKIRGYVLRKNAERVIVGAGDNVRRVDE